MESQFSIDVEKIEWLRGLEGDPGECCAHGHAVANIGDERFEYYATVSATALYLLKSLEEDHPIYANEQFLPCCGFTIVEKGDESSDVVVLGCPNGVDWDLAHEGDCVRITTETGAETVIPYCDYRDEVLRFVDKVEAFYDDQPPRRPEEDDLSAYKAFWREWHRRRANA